MKATGIVRKIDDLGRIVIPMELRRRYDIAEGDPLEIFTDEENIVLRKYNPQVSCVFCEEDNPGELLKFKEKIVCRKCVSNIKASYGR